MLALIPVLPLLGFLANGSWYLFFQARPGQKKASSGVTGALASAAIFGSFLLSIVVFSQLHAMPAESRVLDQLVFPWITVGPLNIDLAFHVDALSSLFLLVITGVGSLIHLYSIGYMGHDESPGKFFAYLNLFCFAMLMLVMGSSLPVLFLGWEGVGLCSYLLIGFWYTDEEKAKAGKKAFVVNRIGDLGFLLGMFLIFSTFHTLDFEGIRQAVAQGNLVAMAGPGTITAICLLLFVGCMGKSAQIPLYVWLPDAMAGPTPVSALIHAATMVTSGIYMVSRLNFLYSMSPDALQFMAWIGVGTAFFAATIAIVQTDIKKVLAYSTVSQLGYMFLGCGVGAYSAGVFHVITHAFFKALMFLGAGSVIHGMHEEQDIMKMGGLRTKMKWTFITFAAGWLAICGIPPFAGFFSKDEILWQAYSSPHGSLGLWIVGAATAVMTAFYMTRLFYLTFLGKPRFDEVHAGHSPDPEHIHDPGHGQPSAVHESPWIMLFPLVILAVLSVCGGAILGWPHHSWLENWLEPIMASKEHASAAAENGAEWVLMGISMTGAVIGIVVAFLFYKDLGKAGAFARSMGGVKTLLDNKWYVDELYEAVFVKPIRALSEFLWKIFDVRFIDRIVLGFGRVSEWTGQTVRVVQTGSIQVYALMLLLGMVVTAGYLIYGLS